MLLYWLITLLFKNPIEFIVAILVLIVPLLFSIVLHEVAHGYVAYLLGDDTPKLTKRLTLNPLKHLDPLGTILLFTVGIGWAKPVLINPENLKTKFNQMLVGIAGPVTNFLIAIVTIIFYVTFVKYSGMDINANNEMYNLFNGLVFTIARINILLAVFNLIPIPPLDGSRVISWILPEFLEKQYAKIEPYGIVIVFLLVFSGGVNFIFKLSNVIVMHISKFFFELTL